VAQKGPPAELDGEARSESHEAVREELLASDLTQQNEQEAALLLCREAGWTDCLTTVVPLQGSTFVLTNHRGDMQLRVKGVLESETRIEVQASAFHRRLRSEDWNSLSPETKDEIMDILWQTDPSNIEIKFLPN
jgi:hypothetical protein